MTQMAGITIKLIAARSESCCLTFSAVNIGVSHNFWEVLEIKYTVRFLTWLPAFFSKSFAAGSLLLISSV